MRITDVDARFAEGCRRILADLDEAETTATGTRTTPRGTLTLTAPVPFSQLFVTPTLVSCLHQFQEVDAQWPLIDRVVNVVEEGIDAAVRIGELPDSSLQPVRVGRVRRVLVASPAYLQARGVPQRPEDPANHVIAVVRCNPFCRASSQHRCRRTPCTKRSGARCRRCAPSSAWLSSGCAGSGVEMTCP